MTPNADPSPQTQLLLVAATPFEIEPTVNWLRQRATREDRSVLHFARSTVEVMITGIGQTATAFALGYRLAKLPEARTLAIQAGVAGAYDRELPLGKVVEVVSERFLDLGAEDQDGRRLELAEIGLAPGVPFDEQGVLRQRHRSQLPYPTVAGGTTNRASGAAATIASIREQHPDLSVESMEGAAFVYACAQAGVRWLQLRAISNYVEPRNRDGWRMETAIASLNTELQRVLTPFIS